MLFILRDNRIGFPMTTLTPDNMVGFIKVSSRCFGFCGLLTRTDNAGDRSLVLCEYLLHQDSYSHHISPIW